MQAANADWVPPAEILPLDVPSSPESGSAASAGSRPRKRPLPAAGWWSAAPLPARPPALPLPSAFSRAPLAPAAPGEAAHTTVRFAIAASLRVALEEGRRGAAAAAAAALIPEARACPLLVLEAAGALYEGGGGDAAARRAALLRLQHLLLDSELTLHGVRGPRVALLPPSSAAALADALCGAPAGGGGAPPRGSRAARGMGRPDAAVAMALRMCAAARGALLATLRFPGLPLGAAAAAEAGAALLRRPELALDPALFFLAGLAHYLQWLQGRAGGAAACSDVAARLLAWRGGGGGGGGPLPTASWLPPPPAMGAADSLPGRNEALEARALAEAARLLRCGVELLVQAARRCIRRCALPAAVREDARARAAALLPALAPWLEPHGGLPLLLHRVLTAAGEHEEAEAALRRFVGEATGASSAAEQGGGGGRAWWDEESDGEGAAGSGSRGGSGVSPPSSRASSASGGRGGGGGGDGGSDGSSEGDSSDGGGSDGGSGGSGGSKRPALPAPIGALVNAPGWAPPSFSVIRRGAPVAVAVARFVESLEASGSPWASAARAAPRAAPRAKRGSVQLKRVAEFIVRAYKPALASGAPSSAENVRMQLAARLKAGGGGAAAAAAASASMDS